MSPIGVAERSRQHREGVVCTPQWSGCVRAARAWVTLWSLEKWRVVVCGWRRGELIQSGLSIAMQISLILQTPQSHPKSPARAQRATPPPTHSLGAPVSPSRCCRDRSATQSRQRGNTQVTYSTRFCFSLTLTHSNDWALLRQSVMLSFRQRCSLVSPFIDSSDSR